MNQDLAAFYFPREKRIVKVSAMSYPQEKVFMSLCNLTGIAVGWTGAIMSTGDLRWLFITLFSSLLMSTMLSVIFKKVDETIQLVASRCGISTFGGICVTKWVAWQFSIEIVHTDPIALAGISALVTAIMFTVGFKALRYLESKSDSLAKRFIDSKVSIIIPPDSNK